MKIDSGGDGSTNNLCLIDMALGLKSTIEACGIVSRVKLGGRGLEDRVLSSSYSDEKDGAEPRGSDQAASGLKKILFKIYSRMTSR